MLKFLEGRDQQLKPKNTIRNKPHIAFGISIEAPTIFQNQYSMVSPSTYVNPFVELQQKRLKFVPPIKLANIAPAWTHKTDMSQIEEGRVISNNEYVSRPDRYHQDYLKQLNKNSSRFRLTKGQFTNDLQRNHQVNQCFGPLQGEERSQQKSLQTKRSIMRKSSIMLQKSRDKLEMQKTLRKQSSRMLGHILDERRVYRHKRDQFYSRYRHQLSERKSPQSNFILPRVLNVKEPAKPHGPNNGQFGLFRTIDTSTLNELIR